MNSFCTFCSGANIHGPHDHFLRSSKELGSKIVCPTLLNTECTFCHRLGHTARFCGVREEQIGKELEKNQLINKNAFEAGEWTSALPSTRRQAHVKVVLPTQRSIAPINRFAALDLQPDGSSEKECVEYQRPSASPSCSSWAQIVKTAPKTSYEEDEDLPPLVFGKPSTTRWSDED